MKTIEEAKLQEAFDRGIKVGKEIQKKEQDRLLKRFQEDIFVLTGGC